MGMLFPPDWDERESRIEQLRNESAATVPVEPGMAGLLKQLDLLRVGLAVRLNSIDDEAVRAKLRSIVQRITQAVTAGRSLDADLQSEAWDDLNTAFVEAQAPLGSWVDEALAPGRPGAEDLPAALRNMWVGTDGSWLLQVFPDADPEDHRQNDHVGEVQRQIDRAHNSERAHEADCHRRHGAQRIGQRTKIKEQQDKDRGNRVARCEYVRPLDQLS